MPCSFRNEAGGAAEILIYGEIGDGWFGGVTDLDFAKELRALGPVSEIRVRINSAGGSVDQGLAMYNLLAGHDAYVIVEIDGLAASIAALVAMAGDEIRIAENARVMIHEAWSIYRGTADDFRGTADILDGLNEDLVTTFAARTGRTREEIWAWLRAETWMGAEAAVERGFADQIVPAKTRPENVVHDLRNFRNVPAEWQGLAFVDNAEGSTTDDGVEDPWGDPGMRARVVQTEVD